MRAAARRRAGSGGTPGRRRACGAGRRAGGAGTGEAAGRGGFGGGGDLKVLLITKGHAYDREPFYQLFDQPPVGASARWTHVEQPAAEIFFDPALAKDYDVFVFYDINGSQPDRRKPRIDKTGKPVLNKDGSPSFTWDPPPADLVANTKALLRQGKPMIFLHHASASWAHSWPEFTEVMGIACDWGQPLRVRGIDHPKSGFFQNTKQRITVVDKAHPITQGLGDGFEIVDESYNCPIFEDSVHPLLRTDFTPKDVSAEPESAVEVQQPRGVGEDSREQPDRLHPARPRSAGVGEPGIPHAAGQRDSLGGVARRDGMGEEESEEDFQELRERS